MSLEYGQYTLDTKAGKNLTLFHKNIDFSSILGNFFANSSCGKSKSMVDFVSKLRYDVYDLRNS